MSPSLICKQAKILDSNLVQVEGYIIQYCGTGNNNIQYFVQLVNSVVVGIKSMGKRFSCEHSI